MIVDLWGAFLDLLPGEWDIFKEWFIWSFLLHGLWLSVKIAAWSILFSLAVGITMAVGRLAPSRLIRWPAAVYVETFRATPLLLLILYVYFGAGRVDGAGAHRGAPSSRVLGLLHRCIVLDRPRVQKGPRVLSRILSDGRTQV